MNKQNQGLKKNRRSFFRQGGLALGAGLASASAGASSLLLDETKPLREQLKQVQAQLAAMEDREALRQLFLLYAGMVENRHYDQVPELFSEQGQVELDGQIAQGRDALSKFFSQYYAEEAAEEIHTAFRQDQAQQHDLCTFSADSQSAEACFHSQVQLSKPIRDFSSLAQMARLQGQNVDSRWENGRFELAFSRQEDGWKISALRYRSGHQS